MVGHRPMQVEYNQRGSKGEWGGSPGGISAGPLRALCISANPPVVAIHIIRGG